MTISVANVANTNTFGGWLAITNRLASIISQNTLTVDTTAGGSTSTGNGYVNGYFGANYLLVNNALYGGNLTVSSSIFVGSNTGFGNSSQNVFIVTTNTTTSNVALTANNLLLSPSGNTTVTGSYMRVNTVNYSVNAVAVYANTVSITGAATLSNTIAVTGAATFSNTISVTNTATFSNTMAVTGAATFSNTISVTNTATFSNTITVAGNTTITSNLVVSSANVTNILNLSNPSATHIVNGNITIVGNMSVTGTTTISSSATATSNFIPASNIAYSLGNSIFWWSSIYTAGVTANTLTLSNNATITGTGTFSNTIAVTGAATFSNTISVTNTATFSNTIAVTGAATFSNTISVTNTATFSNTIAVTGLTTLSANVAVSGVIISNNIGQIYSSSFTFPNVKTVQTIDSFASASVRAAEYLIMVADNNVSPSKYQTSKLLLVHNGTGGTTVNSTEYGIVYTDSQMGDFATTYGSGTITLTFTPNSSMVSTNSVVKFIRTSIAS